MAGEERQAISAEWRRRITGLPTQADIDRCKECWPNDWQAKIAFYNGQVAALLARVTALEHFAYRVSQIDLDESATMALWRMQEQARALLDERR